MELFNCRKCPGKFPIEQMKDENVSKAGFGECIGCKNKRERALKTKNKAKKNPNSHMFCNECERFMHKLEPAGRVAPMREIVCCKFCDSKDIVGASEKFQD